MRSVDAVMAGMKWSYSIPSRGFWVSTRDAWDDEYKAWSFTFRLQSRRVVHTGFLRNVMSWDMVMVDLI